MATHSNGPLARHGAAPPGPKCATGTDSPWVHEWSVLAAPPRPEHPEHMGHFLGGLPSSSGLLRHVSNTKQLLVG